MALMMVVMLVAVVMFGHGDHTGSHVSHQPTEQTQAQEHEKASTD